MGRAIKACQPALLAVNVEGRNVATLGTEAT